MTDETPDPTTDPTPAEADEEGPEFVVTPTLRAFGEVLARLEHLEASQPAIDEDGDGIPDVEQGAPEGSVHARLTRHRTEIEQIKRTINRIIRFLQAGESLPAEVPAAPAPAPTPNPDAAAPAAPTAWEQA